MNIQKLIHDLNNTNHNKYKHFSQCGEDNVLRIIFKHIGETNRYLVDFGAGDGTWLSNSKYFIECGWGGLLMDGNKNSNPLVKHEFITAANIEQLFKKYKVPQQFDFLSIDIDGNDWWIWNAIQNYTPRVVCIEFNGTIATGKSITIKYNPKHQWAQNSYYGASFEALKNLGQKKGYTLVYQLATLNMFFIHKSIVPKIDYTVTYTPQQYHPPAKGGEWVQV